MTNKPRPAPAAATVASVLTAARRALSRAELSYGHGYLDSSEEALCLVMHALSLPDNEISDATLKKRVSAAARQRTLALVRERISKRIPAAYLTHESWLQGLRFYVDERVIVPRSFIAELLTAELYPWVEEPADIRSALDLCTGSACLAVIMAKMFAHAAVDAIDLSPQALEVARINVARHRLGRRIRLVESDLFSAAGKKRYDLIISNPPYVTTASMRKLPPEYRSEPAMALAGGGNGFDLVDLILTQAADHLTAQGTLVVEIGHHRSRLEQRYPRLPFFWPETSGGDDCVFVLKRADLVAPGALQVQPARRRAIS